MVRCWHLFDIISNALIGRECTASEEVSLGAIVNKQADEGVMAAFACIHQRIVTQVILQDDQYL